MTELVFILDQSGSMSGLESDTIGGFNSMIERQKKEEGNALVSTVLFNNKSTVIHDRLPLDEVIRMSDADYCPQGCTALLDAVGDAIHHIGISINTPAVRIFRNEHFSSSPPTVKRMPAVGTATTR